MKYFSLDTVISSFEENKNKTSDGFWGIMAILRSLDCKILPCTQYDLDCQKIANILESWFSVRDTYKTYNTSAVWYVVFSSKWVDQLSMFVKDNPAPNIYNVIAWMYQHHSFESTPSNSDLISLFCKDTAIEFDELRSLFDMSERELKFSYTHFSQTDKVRMIVSKFGSAGSNNSIKSNGSYIVAEAGAFQRAPFTQTLYASSENYKCLMITSAAPDVYYPANFNEHKNITYSPVPRQVIYFGAPGTGKSHAVNKIVKEQAPKNNIRTTFHPDSDYSSFVGCYKPTMRGGNIEYSFTAQAFIKAYIGAWSDLSKPFFLVIEEINRGNCAQIFGDIFQLLDRDKSGQSSYSIKPDSDLQSYIEERLKHVPDLPEEIASGDEMRLPSNLYIYATMNTSDQSLFPIDSAFKRRWDWRYTAIKPVENEHVLTVGSNRYKWSSFIKNVNKKILDLTKSEDKQLGYWFITPDDNHEIDWKIFASKALFYIWNDVVKDYATLEKADSPFGRNYAFTTYFDENGEILIERVTSFLEALEVEKMPNDNVEKSESNIDNRIDDDTIANTSSNPKAKFTLNGNGYDTLGSLMVGVVESLAKRYNFESLQDKLYSALKINRADSKGGIQPGYPSELNQKYGDEYHNKFVTKEFVSSDGVIFSLINGWSKSDFDKIRQFIDSNKDIFPNGLIIQNETSD